MLNCTHKQLVDIGYKWIMKRCGVAFRELKSLNYEIPDVIGFTSGESFLIECKANRADYLNDKSKFFRIHPEQGMGKFRFYLCPTGLISINELPDNWGLIYVNSGKAKCVHNPYGGGNIYSNWGYHKRNKDAEMRLMYSALRRLHIRGRIDEIYEKMLNC